jgi:hypothetical protein
MTSERRPIGGLWWTRPDLRDDPAASAAQREVEQRRMNEEAVRVPDSKLQSGRAGRPTIGLRVRG